MNEENNSEANTQSNQTNSGDGPNKSPQSSGEVFHPEIKNSTSSSSEPTPSLTPDSTTEASSQPTVTNQPIKKNSKKGILLVIFVLLLALGSAAAWYLTQKDEESDNTATTQKETIDIELLRIGTGEGPASVFFPDEGLIGIQNIMDRQVYEGLVGIENNKIVPLIAQSWSNPDEKTWVFKIHPNVKFHTGKSVTAKEVKASLENLKNYETWSAYVSTIASIEATSDLELTVKTKQPDALFLNRLILAYISDLTVTDRAGNNGTGSYQVDTSVKNDEVSTTLIAFNDYYGARAKTRKLKYTVYESDEAIVKALANKEIDIAETAAAKSVTKDAENAENNSLEYESPGVYGLYLNQVRSTTTIIKNKDFRQAIALAVERDKLVEEVGRDILPVSHVIPKTLPGYEESISFPKYDLTAAKASLTKSGYSNQPLEFIYVQDYQLEAPILIKQLKALGLNITPKPFTTDQFADISNTAHSGNFDFFFAGYTSDLSDARDILGRLLHSTESSYPVYKNPTYDKILTDSDQEFDPTKRIQLLQQANKLILDDFAWIPLRNGAYTAYSTKDIDLKNEFNGTGSIGIYYRKVGRIEQ